MDATSSTLARTSPTPAEQARESFLQWYDGHTRAAYEILLRPGHGPMNRPAAARALRRLATAAGIERNVTPHDLRRAYISGMLDAGASLRDAQTAARHADPRMTMRYDRARFSLDRHPNYSLATWIAGAA